MAVAAGFAGGLVAPAEQEPSVAAAEPEATERAGIAVPRIGSRGLYGGGRAVRGLRRAGVIRIALG
jgi:hypothetical protein